MLPRIEENLGETLYREYFYPCKTIELQAKDGSKRIFVEFSEATDYGADIRLDSKKPEMALSNVVRRLLAEHNNDFFFCQNEKGVNSHVLVDGTFYWLKSTDITESWGNHYWTRTRKPVVGFKTISKDGKSVVSSYKSDNTFYEIGKSYQADETAMLALKDGYFFSPQLEKALYYTKDDTQTCMVVATGLILIKNQWNDMCAQNLTIIRRLTKSDIKLLCPDISAPKAFWNGAGWDSHDADFYDEYIWRI